MDLLFKRYASPFVYLDSLMELGRLKDGIEKMIEEDGNDRLWQLYLHSFPKQSFKDWKNTVLTPKAQELSMTEMTTIVSESQDILKSFSIVGKE